MKNFTFILFCLLSTFFIMAGCSDGDEKPDEKIKSEYYFRFKVNGILEEYIYQPETQINLTGGKYYNEENQLHIIQVSGHRNIFQPQQNTVVLQLFHTEDIATGITYSNISSPSSVLPQFFGITYIDNDGKTYLATNNNPAFPMWEIASFKFDRIDATGMKGTFSAIGKTYDTTTGQSILTGRVEITDGEFYVPRNNEL
ncbi:hypothetical protein PBT90_09215 [Algoriphagus halophytocola]|uniref:LPS export ABC transporter periplasmic protein LptC n=1 Tax=Algoriphagus halophytocola TaxID=2991499 RepID=A0ABY6MIF9_9BACT|nr:MULTISPECIES: hypothetical protein [unclassified Algoriphagus]UZD23567.1 hypothetical protein OM944_03545 [Algoriphagus sp. TR-M5]WBL44861.1 hypothetical protein PBT90_09215 [Algoriphagus sp. TR-M9]